MLLLKLKNLTCIPAQTEDQPTTGQNNQGECLQNEPTVLFSNREHRESSQVPKLGMKYNSKLLYHTTGEREVKQRLHGRCILLSTHLVLPLQKV